jgi:hypothetical protein
MSDKKKLRSQKWFGRQNKMGFVHRSWLRNVILVESENSFTKFMKTGILL